MPATGRAPLYTSPPHIIAALGGGRPGCSRASAVPSSARRRFRMTTVSTAQVTPTVAASCSQPTRRERTRVLRVEADPLDLRTRFRIGRQIPTPLSGGPRVGLSLARRHETRSRRVRWRSQCGSLTPRTPMDATVTRGTWTARHAGGSDNDGRPGQRVCTSQIRRSDLPAACPVGEVTRPVQPRSQHWACPSRAPRHR
jgi:hypothetical protein